MPFVGCLAPYSLPTKSATRQAGSLGSSSRHPQYLIIRVARMVVRVRTESDQGATPATQCAAAVRGPVSRCPLRSSAAAALRVAHGCSGGVKVLLCCLEPMVNWHAIYAFARSARMMAVPEYLLHFKTCRARVTAVSLATKKLRLLVSYMPLAKIGNHFRSYRCTIWVLQQRWSFFCCCSGPNFPHRRSPHKVYPAMHRRSHSSPSVRSARPRSARLRRRHEHRLRARGALRKQQRDDPVPPRLPRGVAESRLRGLAGRRAAR